MRTGWLLAAGGLAALFVLFLTQSMNLTLMDELGPGPGFFPLAISLVGVLCACALALQVWRDFPTEDNSAQMVGRGAQLRLTGVLASVTGATLALEPLGYTLTALLLVPVVLVVLGARSPVGISVVSLTMSFGVFHVFYHWLDVALPVGVVGI